MDPAAFDRLTTTFATSGTRRAMLGLSLGSLLTGLGRESAPAKNKKNNKKKGKGCPKGKKKCDNKCISKASCCTYVDCTGCRAENCINGTCQCDPELIMHNGKCGYFINCKGFGETCASNEECCGNCVFDVDANESRCGKSIHDCITDADCLSGPCNGYLCPEANKPYFDLCVGLRSCPNCA